MGAMKNPQHDTVLMWVSVGDYPLAHGWNTIVGGVEAENNIGAGGILSCVCWGVPKDNRDINCRRYPVELVWGDRYI